LRSRAFLLIAVLASSASAAHRTPAAAELQADAGRIAAVAAMLPAKPAGLGPPITDRDEWTRVARSSVAQTIVREAAERLAQPLVPMTDELFLEFSRNGNRTRWQEVSGRRRERLDLFALAECLEGRGRFVTAFGDTLKSVCAERTWVMPAHDVSLANFKGTARQIDLASSSLAWSLATADWLLADRLDAPTRGLLREQVARRVLEPFREMVQGQRPADWWLTGSNNWNAVCLSGVTGAALALIDSREDRGFYVASAEKLSRHFLAGIPADGYCTEGVGYWNYGFGRYVLLAETILQATSGRLDLLDGEHARRCGMYGFNIEIVPGVCPSFSDCAVTARPGAWLTGYLARRWGLPTASTGPWKYELGANEALYQGAMLAFTDGPTMPVHSGGAAAAGPGWTGPGIRTWFETSGVLITRPGNHAGCRLAAAMKGGHNAEEHNHNDVGSYLVVVDGRAVLVDPGSEVYTARTFSPQRYDSKVINSFGHPVPVVAGKLQRTGRNAQGRVVRSEFADDRDTLVLDLSSAYEVPSLSKLTRTLVYDRTGGGSLEVTDEVEFKEPQAFGSALITFGQWRSLSGGNRIRVGDASAGVEVGVEGVGGNLIVKAEEIRENLTIKQTPIRIGLNLDKPVTRGRIRLSIRPSEAGTR
jgi:hypothetical protein